MIQALYLPSTPLNVLVSAALANQFREQHQAQIWLIDQKHLANNPYVKALETWRDSPFEQVKILPGLAKGLQHKLIERKDNFERLQHGLQTFHPDIVAVGSDRRIEFQYVMHQLKKSKHPAQGWYLDDGLYSYAGRPYHTIKDGINRWLKKLSYGFWWDEPKTVGASHWIHQAWLFQPEQVYPLLTIKKLKKIQSEWFYDSNIKTFSQLVADQFGFEPEKIENVDLILILPHPNDMEKMLGYAQRVKSFVSSARGNGLNVAVKYHPRELEEDRLNFAEIGGIEIIPATLAFEFVLPFLKSATFVLGDVCTVVMTARWLREDISASAILDATDAYQQSFLSIFNRLNIPVYSSFEQFFNQNIKGKEL